jgi:hypothetical protein
MHVDNGKPYRVHGLINDHYKSFTIPFARAVAIASTVVLELTESVLPQGIKRRRPS